MPAPAARLTPTPSACLPAPGSASSGPAGSPARPTTPPDTEPQPPSPNDLLANLPPEVETEGVIDHRPGEQAVPGPQGLVRPGPPPRPDRQRSPGTCEPHEAGRAHIVGPESDAPAEHGVGQCEVPEELI